MSDDLELNLVFTAPKPKAAPSARSVKVAEFRAKQAAAPKREWTPSTNAGPRKPRATAASSDAASAASSDAAPARARAASKPAAKTTNSRPAGAAAALARAALKRKAVAAAVQAGHKDDDEHAAGDDVDGDAHMANGDEDGGDDDDVEEIASKAMQWQALKQPRYDGSTDVKSAASASAAASSEAGADSAATPASSGAKKAPFRAVSKPLPKIVRHASAKLDAKAMKPVAPSDVEEKTRREVFGVVEDQDVEMKDGGVKQEGDENGHVKAELPPLPTTGFGALGLSDRVHRALVEKLHMKYPTKIQKEGIPLLLSGQKDALVKSETGSGKTLTYLIPIVERLSTEATRVDRSQGTRAIVLSPTRELCLQIQGVLSSLLEKSAIYWLVSGIIMGGEKKNKEKARLRKGIHILICTPGRLLDHLENTEALVLSRLSYFVLDESDRLMDMGFEKDLTKIVHLLDEKSTAKPPSSGIRDPRTGLEIKSPATRRAEEERRNVRQNILVSATLNKEIEAMAAITLKDPILIGFKTASTSSSELQGGIKMEDGTELRNANMKDVEDTEMPSNLVQLYLQVEHRHKLVALAALLRKKVVESEMNNRNFKACVFFSTSAAVEFHHALFKYSYWPYERNGGYDGEKMALIDTPVMKLHGNLTQQERTKTYQQFCANAEGILLCTDVAARGLDLPAVDHIFQYDPPEDTADYIHRVGRTARMGRKGQAILFLMSSEMEYLTVLKDKSITPEPLSFAHILQSLHSDAAKNKIYDDARGGTPAGAILQKQFEALVSNQLELKESAINAYHSYLRAYAAYPKALKSIFHPRMLHIGHVARSFALADAPTQLARGEIVAKQRKTEEREREREKERKETAGEVGASSASNTNKKRLVPEHVPAKKGPASAGADAASDAPLDGISSGVRPAFGQRDRARNIVAQANDTAFEARKAAKKPKMELSTVGWKLGTEGTGGQANKTARTGIDRARSNKVAQVFKKKKMDLVSEFAS